MSTQRNYKDALFRAIFKQSPELLQLYNAIFHTALTDANQLKLSTLDYALSYAMRNDLSFYVGNKAITLIEQQSTANGNMALRLLFYLAQQYLDHIPDDELYREKTYMIRTPYLYVLRIGDPELPPLETKYLSEAFLGGKGDLDLAVHTYNITYGTDCPLFAECPTLEDYSHYVYLVNKYQKEGLIRDDAIAKAIEYCKTHGILKSYISTHQSEVIQLTKMEWNLDTALRVKGEEEHEKGQISIIMKMLQNHMSVSDVANIVQWPIDRVREIAKTNKIVVTE